MSDEYKQSGDAKAAQKTVDWDGVSGLELASSEKLLARYQREEAPRVNREMKRIANSIRKKRNEISESKPKEPTTMSEKKQPKTKTEKPEAGAKFRLVTFAELTLKHQGAGLGSAFEICGELCDDGHVSDELFEQYKQHKYVINQEKDIFGVALWDGAGWAQPRDIVLWQAMTVNIAIAESGERNAESGRVKAPAGGQGWPDSDSDSLSMQWLHRAEIKPWADQPRKHFDEAFVLGLSGVMREKGASPAFPLLVRPSGNGFEIADGERRWRAAGIAGIDRLPCVVQALSDAEMLELAMISSIHKKELSPMEEALGLKRMLELESPEGVKIHSLESVARTLKLAADTVQGKLSLTRLAGSEVAAQLEAGVIYPGHAELIARVPGAAAREKVLAMVLNPASSPGPMPVKELRRQLSLNWMVELRGVRWSLDDAELLPVEMERGERVSGGACSDCPWKAMSEGARSLPMCMSPGCYRAKEAAVHSRWVQAKDAEGKKALSMEENAQVFGSDGVKLSATTDYVDLDETPDADDVASKDGELPPWKKLVAGAEVPVVIALDAKGKEHALVPRELAVAAAALVDSQKPAEKQVLVVEEKPKGLSAEEEKARVLAEKAENVKAERIAKAEMAALVAAARMPVQKLTADWLTLVVSGVVGLVPSYDLASICARRGWKEEGMSDAEVVMTQAAEIEQHELPALLTELLCDNVREFSEDWAAALGVDLKKVRKEEEKAMKTEAGFEKKKKKEAALVVWSEEPAAYEWNEAGVCVNPVVGMIDLGKKITAEVKVAEGEKGWVYGFAFMTAETGSSSPVSQKGTHYDTRALAERAGLLAVKQYCEGIDMAAVEKIAAFLKGDK